MVPKHPIIPFVLHDASFLVQTVGYDRIHLIWNCCLHLFHRHRPFFFSCPLFQHHLPPRRSHCFVASYPVALDVVDHHHSPPPNIPPTTPKAMASNRHIPVQSTDQCPTRAFPYPCGIHPVPACPCPRH